MKGAAPGQTRHDAAVAALAALRQHFCDNSLRALDHLLRGAARECQHHDARGIRAVQNEVSGSIRQGVGFTGSRAGQDQQGPGTDPLIRNDSAKCRRAALAGIQRVKCVCFHFHHGVRYCTYIQIETQLN